MTDPQQLLALCERGVELGMAAGADEAEVYAVHSDGQEVHYLANDLDHAASSTETTFGVRVFADHRLGFATANHPGALAEVCTEAVAMARCSPPDPVNGLPDPAPLSKGAAPDPALETLGLEGLTRLATELLAAVRADPRVAVDSGVVGVSHSVRAIASSRGVRATHRGSVGHGNIFGMAVDGDEVGSFSYDGDLTQRAADLEGVLRAAFGRFADKCVGALGAGKGESFRGAIIVPADTLGGLFLGDLLYALGADAVRKGSSPLADRVGEAVASPLFSLTEAGPGLPGHPLAPFDREGQPRRSLDLIDQGVLRGFLYDSYEARAAGAQPTGHAVGGASSTPTTGPSTLRVAPGTTPTAALKQGERAILVTRFSGSSNPHSGDFSGVVKGGFLLDGGTRRPVRETTLSGNLYECLKNISAVSSETTRLQGSREYPWLRIEDVSITAG